MVARPVAAVVCYDVGVRASLALVCLLAAGCHHRGGAHWPKSAGTEVDPEAEDGGESLEPRRVSEQAAAVEHGGEDITAILDEPSPVKAAATPAPASAAPATGEPTVEVLPVFDEIIIIGP